MKNFARIVSAGAGILFVLLFSQNCGVMKSADQMNAQERALQPFPSSEDSLDLQNVVARAVGGSHGTLLHGTAMLTNTNLCDDPLDPVFLLFKSCFGTNPAAPYIIPMIPTRAGEYVDPYYKDVWTQTISGTRSSAIYRMSHDDANIFIIRLPPRAAYFGIQSYLFTRYDLGNSKPSADPDRIDLFASIGNSINNRSIEAKIGSPWGHEIVVISSANPSVASNLKDLLLNGGVKAEIFIEPIGGLIKRGLDKGDDDMITLVRFALPEDDVAAEAWRAAVISNVKVMKWVAPNANTDVTPNPVLETKTANSEQGLMSSQTELMTLLRQGLGVSRLARSKDFLPLSSLVGPDCIRQNINCLGDSQDTDAYRYFSVGPMGSSHHLLVVGVNHIQTGNAAYISLAIQNSGLQAGIIAKSQAGGQAGFVKGELQDSARQMLQDLGLWNTASPTLKNNIASLYAAVFSRNCAGIPVPCDAISAEAVPLGDSISVLRRAYLRNDSARGADPTQLLSPIGVDWTP